MWRNDRERPGDPQTRERETQRLSRDEYERPLYGSPQPPQQERQHAGSPPRQNQGPSYDRAAWSYRSQPAVATRFRGDPRGARPPQGVREQPPRQPSAPPQSNAGPRSLEEL